MMGRITAIHKNKPDFMIPERHGRIKSEDNSVHYFFLNANPESEDLELGDSVSFEEISVEPKDSRYRHRNTVCNVKKNKG